MSNELQRIFFRCAEDSNEAIMITDTSGRLIYVNPAWSQIYGFTNQEALQSTPRILHSGYHTNEFYKEMWDSILKTEKGFWKGEVINKAKDGRLIPVLLTITSAKDSLGKIIGYMAIALDISSQKDLEAKVLRQDRLASIGILASGLAHEIGTPLGVIRGRAEFLMMQAEDNKDPFFSTSLKTIVDQIDRISGLIHSLLRFSRSSDDLNLKSFSLKSIVLEVISLLSQNFKSKLIHVDTNISEDHFVYADSNRVQQILLNILINSMHAIEEAIARGRKEDHKIRINSSVDFEKNMLCVEIFDTGCGIKKENMIKLFQPFFTTKEIGKGTGLGLAIVSKIIVEMNGEISVDSIENKETTFKIWLPIHSQNQH